MRWLNTTIFINLDTKPFVEEFSVFNTYETIHSVFMNSTLYPKLPIMAVAVYELDFSSLFFRRIDTQLD